MTVCAECHGDVISLSKTESNSTRCPQKGYYDLLEYVVKWSEIYYYLDWIASVETPFPLDDYRSN